MTYAAARRSLTNVTHVANPLEHCTTTRGVLNGPRAAPLLEQIEGGGICPTSAAHTATTAPSAVYAGASVHSQASLPLDVRKKDVMPSR